KAPGVQRPQTRPDAALERLDAILVKIQPRLLEQEAQKTLFIFRQGRPIPLASQGRIVRQRQAFPNNRSSEGNMAKLRRPRRERLAFHFHRHVPSPRSQIPTILILGHYRKEWKTHAFPNGW